MSEGVIDETAGRVYHGVADDRDGHRARILVMDSGGGPDQRKKAIELYELTPKPPCWWGYKSGTTGSTADGILDDVLRDAVPAAALADMPPELRNAFVDDFLVHFHDGREFWLSASAVVRWIHGFLWEAGKA